MVVILYCYIYNRMARVELRPGPIRPWPELIVSRINVYSMRNILNALKTKKVNMFESKQNGSK